MMMSNEPKQPCQIIKEALLTMERDDDYERGMWDGMYKAMALIDRTRYTPATLPPVPKGYESWQDALAASGITVSYVLIAWAVHHKGECVADSLGTYLEALAAAAKVWEGEQQ